MVWKNQRAVLRASWAWTGIVLALALIPSSASRAQLMARLEHRVVGARLRVSPEELFVPRNVPGSLSVTLTAAAEVGGAELARLAQGTHVEAVLRGPAFAAYRLLGLPNEPLLLPPLALAGDYRIDDIRLVNTASGEVLMFAEPSSVRVNVFPELLVSQVTSRPLSLEELESRGVVIDGSRFSAVEFEVSMVISGRSFPVYFPVVSPKFDQVEEIIPLAELEDRRVAADHINRGLALSLSVPEPLRLPLLDIYIQGINFQEAGGGDGVLPQGVGIPALIVIPGNVGFLNQFFSVQVYTANAAPRGSSISVHSMQAEIVLPAGKDKLPGSADDPLALAAVGPEASELSVRPLVGFGADGVPGTADDQTRLVPGETGSAEFLVEGRQEGLHTFDLKLRGILDGAGPLEVPVEGRAVGSVSVRNPRFSVVFSHPDVVRTGEPYTASVTVMNTSEVTANLVSIGLNRASISGAAMVEGGPERVELGTIAPGQSRTGSFRLIAQRTGAVQMANITGGPEITGGRFDFTLGVDERGIRLSSDTILYPEWIRALPESVQRAADRVLGQALSIVTAGSLPPGVRRLDREVLRTRVLELAEAGQRILYGDAPERVYLDLLLDWHGGRVRSLGFDQILRETDAGIELMQALSETLGGTSGAQWLNARAADLAGRGEAWTLLATGDPSVLPGVRIDGIETTTRARTLTESGAIAGFGGWLMPLRSPADRLGALEFGFTVPAGAASIPVSFLTVESAGSATRYDLVVTADPLLKTCYRVFPGDDPTAVVVDLDCDRSSDGALTLSSSPVQELPPSLLAALQDPSVHLARPGQFCGGPAFERLNRTVPYRNYGTVVAALFSKPMSDGSMASLEAFKADGMTPATSVQLQPGGRIALVNFRNALSTAAPHGLLATGVTDPRGGVLPATQLSIETLADEGVSIRGRVIGGDGAPAAGVPVTVTMLEGTGAHCFPVDVRASRAFTDSEGRFAFEFVMGGTRYGYRISATDTRGLPSDLVNLVLRASPTGPLSESELRRLAADPAVQAMVESHFPDEAYRGVIAGVASADRAVFEDNVHVGSPRIGSEVPVVLRFRGRGTVRGRVLLSDGQTAAPNVIVNLYPADTSREKPRGLRSDATGAFEFLGVPLGEFSLKAEAPSGLFRTLAGRLDVPGQVATMDIVLSGSPPPRGDLEGIVFDDDGLTPHASAQVAVYRGREFLAVGASDEGGGFRFPALPTTTADGATSPVAVRALSRDRRRTGRSAVVTLQAGAVVLANVVLEGVAEVVGRVEFANGAPAAGARVAGGEAIVTTAGDGTFTLTGVPVGPRTIAAGLEANPSLDIEFTRLGQATMRVLPGVQNHVVVRLESVGRISGTVRDTAGTPIANTRVAIPVSGGFYWVDADAAGRYVFPRLGLGPYTLSAPSPPVDPDSPGALESLAAGASADEMLAAAISDLQPILRSRAERLDPTTAAPFTGRWGFTRTRLDFDGQSVVADISYLPEGQLSGRTENHRGLPFGAEFRVTGLMRSDTGGPDFFGELAKGRTHASTGEFAIGALKVGKYTVSAVSPFYRDQPRVAGETTLASLNADGLILRFSGDQRARVTGVVVRDGIPVGAGATVQIGGGDYQIQTDASGRFDTQIELPFGVTRVRAFDPATGRAVELLVRLDAPVVDLTIPLLANDGALLIRVQDSSGASVPSITTTVQRAGYPERSYQVVTGGNGQVLLPDLFEGGYSATACSQQGQNRLCGTVAAEVRSAEVTNVTITLAPRGVVRGVYIDAAGQVVADAQVAVGLVGFAVTGADGRFELEGVPLGDHRVLATNAVTGRAAQGLARVQYEGHTVEVSLREDALGEVSGRVIGPDGTSLVPGAVVVLMPSHPLFAHVQVTSGPAGDFVFPGAPPGAFELRAQVPNNDAQRGIVRTSMPDPATSMEVDIPLNPLATVRVTVREADGSLVGGALVNVQFQTVTTDAQGLAEVRDLALGLNRVEAKSTVPGRTRSAGYQDVRLDTPAQPVDVTVTLSGVGSVGGIVRNANGTAAPHAEVVLNLSSANFTRLSTLSGTDGRFEFTDVAPGPIDLRARLGALAASATDVLVGDGGSVDVELTLTPAATLRGRLVRADGVTPLPFELVAIEYDAPSGLPGAAQVRTSSTAEFEFLAVPEGPFVLRADITRYDGRVYAPFSVNPGVSELDVGDVLLDEESPEVVEILPADGATGVDPSASIEIVFSEAMETIDPSVQAVYLTGGTVPVQVGYAWELTPGTGEYRTLRLTPSAPLEGETTYSLVIAAAPGAGGNIAQGPTDLARRTLLAPVVSRFTTRDTTPPMIVSFTPASGAEQVAADGVLRIEFSEPMLAPSVLLSLEGPQGTVAGTMTFLFTHRVLVFTPAADLDLNATYVATLSAATDLAGNPVANLPRVHAFQTLDTEGPVVTDLQLETGSSLIQGAVARFRPTFLSAEPGVQVQLTKDLSTILSAAIDVASVAILLTDAGPLRLYARGVDRFGNFGQWFQADFVVGVNSPPVLSLVRINPTSGPLRTGQSYAFRVDAIDDGAIARIRARLSGALTADRTELNTSLVLFSGTLSSALGPGLEVLVNAEAEDNSGATSSFGPVSIPVADGTAPTLLVTSPASVVPGDTVVLDVVVTDVFGATLLTMESTGLVETADGGPLSVPQTNYSRSFSFVVPPTITGSGTIQVVVRAADAAGNETTTLRTISVLDVTSPQVTSISPANGALAVAATTTVDVVFSEAVSASSVNGATFTLTSAAGPVAATATRLAVNTARLTPSSLLDSATQYTVALSSGVTDLAGNPLVPFSSTFTTDETFLEGPRIVSVDPQDGATNVRLRPYVEYIFDDPVTLASAPASAFILASEDGVPIFSAITRSFFDGGLRVRFNLQSSLTPGRTYQARLAGTLQDAAGNFVLGPNGQPFTEYVTSFTAARVEMVLAGDDRVVERYPERAQIFWESEAPYTYADWFVDGAPAGRSFRDSAEVIELPIPSIQDRPSGTVAIRADVYVTSAGLISLAEKVLLLEPEDGDFDGDGLTNGAEQAAWTSPWVDDADEDPDGDTLTNAQEIALGTDPFNPDTDGDGISDADDLDPLSGNRVPGVGLVRDGTSILAATTQLNLPAAARIQSPFTVELWTLPNYWPHNDVRPPVLFSSGDGAFSIAFDTLEERFSFALATDQHSGIAYDAPFGGIPYNWHHVALTYDGARLRGYVDGWRAVDVPVTGAVSYLAGASTRTSTAYGGLIAEVRVWDVALTGTQIQLGMHRAPAAGAAGLYAYWPLTDITSGIAADASGRGLDASVSLSPFAVTYGPPVFEERSIQLAGSSAPLPIGVYDFDTVVARLVVSRLPDHGELFEASYYGPGLGPVLTSTPTFYDSTTGQSFVYSVAPGYFGQDEIELFAEDGISQSRPVRITFETPPTKEWAGADMVDPSDWSRPNNWLPSGVPGPGDRVSIPPGLVDAVRLDVNTTVAGFALGAGSILDIGAQTLEVSGHICANDGEIRGSGEVVFSGLNAHARGRFPIVRVTGDVVLSGAVTVQGDLLLDGYGVLRVREHLLRVEGDVLVNGGALNMSHVDGEVEILGDLVGSHSNVFGSPAPNELVAGTLRLSGDLDLGTSGSCIIQASGAHVTILEGEMPQTISALYSWSGCNNFQDLIVRNPSGVTALTDIWIDGALQIEPGSSLVVQGGLNAGSLELGAAAGVTVAGTLGVQGTTTLQTGSSLNADRLVADGLVSLGEGATLQASSMRLNAGFIAAPTASASVVDLELTGPPPIGLSITNLSIEGTVDLTQSMAIPGDLRLPSSVSRVRFGPHNLSVGGELQIDFGRLEMTDPAGTLDVTGDVRIGTPTFCSASILSAGTLRARGSFSVLRPNCYAPTDTHRTVLESAATRSLSFVSPGSGFSANKFHHLEVVGGSLNLGSDVHVAGNLVSNAVVAGAGRLVGVGGTTQILAPGGFDVGRFEANGGLSTSDGALDAGTFVVSTAAEIPPLFEFGNLEVKGLVTVGRDLAVPGNVIIYRQATTGLGAVDVDTYTLLVGGNLTLNGPVIMDEPAARVEVLGSLLDTNQCTAGAPSIYTAGELRVAGNIDLNCLSTSLRAGPAHRLVLNGLSPQTVDLSFPWMTTASAGQRVLFGTVVVENLSGVTFTSDARASGDLLLESDVPVLGNSLYVDGALSTEAGSSLVLSNELRLYELGPSNLGAVNSNRLIVDNLITQVPAFGFVHLDILAPVSLASSVSMLGTLLVNGSQGGALTVAGRTLTVGTDLLARGPVHMTSASDVVVVMRHADFGGSGCSNTPSNLREGVLSVGGNFQQLTTCTQQSFAAADTHRTVFAGTGSTVRFNSATQSRFATLEVEAGASASQLTNVNAARDTRLRGTWTNPGPASRRLDIVGALEVTATGTLNNSGTITAGSCSIDPSATLTGVAPVCP